jgi:hypothetical protein
LEAWYPLKSSITVCAIDDVRFLQELYPEIAIVKANGLNLPFRDKAFDFVHCAAVLQHVGSFENQVGLIAECARVAKRVFFLTTPNRWFPIEVHTLLPLVHWLPRPISRNFMRQLGYNFFADEQNLNLMSASDLRRALDRIPELRRFRPAITSIGIGGWPSNLLVYGKDRGNRTFPSPQGGATPHIHDTARNSASREPPRG